MPYETFLSWVGVARDVADEWVALGLPVEQDGTVDAHEASEWLIRKGIASSKEYHGVVGTLAEVAQAFGVSYDVVAKRWRQDGMPGNPGDKGMPGHYDLAAIAEWKASRARDPDPGAIDVALRRKAAEARIFETRAEKAELELAQKRGALLDRDDAERHVAALITNLKNQLLKLPERLAPSFPESLRMPLMEEARRRVEELLVDLANWRATPEGEEEA